MPILFYLRKDAYGWLSNFSHHAIEMDGNVWPTVEHYYQAQKFVGTDYENVIRQAPDAWTAKLLAHDGTHPLRSDWDAVKYGIMEQAVRKKFETHDDLRDLLLRTENEVLMEDAPDDYYWGRGADGTGANHLGEILMEARALLRQRDQNLPR